MTAPVLEGAEPFSSPGSNGHGVLVCHGFTGNPQSMRGLAKAFAGAGFTVELPLLPGHGTHVDDMHETSWADWSAAAEAAFSELAGRCAQVVVAGLSMGGTLATWLAAHHPVAGLVAVNPAIEPAESGLIELLRETLASGTTAMPAIGNDVADPSQRELAYDEMPVGPLLSLLEAQAELAPRLGEVTCPTLLITSRQDHVVPPANSDYLAAHVAGPVERVWLERSYHVATLDYDREEIEARSVTFAQRVTSA